MPADRLNAVFRKCADENRAAFVGYLMAADPDIETSFACLKALLAAGADVIEIGAPFTDPMADGPSIQRAAQRSLAHEGKLSVTFELARRLRLVDNNVGLVLMGYANPVHRMGFDAFAQEAGLSGIDGVITVDLPPEEDAPLREPLALQNISAIRLATPTTSEARMRRIAEGASGFIYYVSVAGVTGAGVGRLDDISAGVDRARRLSGLPVAVGFGVRTPEQAAEFARIADGVVVGSALVDEIRAAVEADDPQTAPARISVVAKSLSTAIVSARS